MEDVHSSRVKLETRLEELTKELDNIKGALDQHAIVAFTDHHGKILSVNDKLCLISQYSRAELIGNDLRIINSGYHSKEFIRTLWATISSGHTWKGEIKNRAKDGSYYWVDTTVVPFLDDSGLPSRYVAIQNDITVRKQTDEALRESEDQFQTLANSIPELAWTAHADGFIFWYNQRWYDFTGKTPAEMEGWGWQSVHDPEVLPKVLERWTASIATGQAFEMQFPLRAADGQFRSFLTRVMPRKDASGRVVQWFGTNTDITKLKRSEEVALERLRLATRAANVGIWDWDVIQNIMLWDDTMFEIYGGSRDRFSGAYDAWETALHPGDLLRMRSEIEWALSGEKEYDTEFRVLWPDGSIHYVQANGSVLRDDSGQALRMLGTNWDTTARKQAEEELITAKRAAESATRVKSEFLAMMSHEIRTPMNAILGIADLLSESQLDSTQRQYVEIFRRNGSTLLALINDILDLSKIEAGKFELEQVEFSLDDVLRQALEVIASLARTKGLTLTLDQQAGTPASLVGDPSKLRQVLVNLLGNAVKFTDFGEVRLKVRLGNSGQTGEITFAVKDTGPGIPPEELERIFVDFAQGDSSTTRKFGGTGLGLGISRRLVELMGGRLQVTSTLGQGSEFTFSAIFQIDHSYQVRRHVQNLNGYRVLMIDDDEVNRLVLREALGHWGIESQEFSQADAALGEIARAVAESKPYSLVIVDQCMPGIDGFETARRIRSIAPDLPIIMLSSDRELGDEVRRVEAGIAGFALKPVGRPELRQLISKAMRVTISGPSPAVLAAPQATLSILVAEDFADNRVIVQAYLQGLPYTITFANDGRHAVDLFVSGRFDLVFMDVLMPVMDGLAATRVIRAFEAQNARIPTPIIALTANARAEDIEASRRAGCSDHLSKPISKHTLLQCIAHTTLNRPSVSTSSVNAIQIEPPEGLEELVPPYLETRRRDVKEAAVLLARGDFAELASIAHNIAGTGAAYGFQQLTELGASLEQSARAGDSSVSEQALAAMSDYLGRVCIIPVRQNPTVAEH